MFYDNSYAAQNRPNAHINGKLDILYSNALITIIASVWAPIQDDCFVDLAVTSNTFEGHLRDLPPGGGERSTYGCRMSCSLPSKWKSFCFCFSK